MSENISAERLKEFEKHFVPAKEQAKRMMTEEVNRHAKLGLLSESQWGTQTRDKVAELRKLVGEMHATADDILEQFYVELNKQQATMEAAVRKRTTVNNK